MVVRMLCMAGLPNHHGMRLRLSGWCSGRNVPGVIALAEWLQLPASICTADMGRVDLA